MAFCQKCGTELAGGAKFCPNCGTAAGDAGDGTHSTRVQKFEGEIHKCPHCGATLGSFVTKCPECGNEIRGGGELSSNFKKFLEEYEKLQPDTSLFKRFSQTDPITKRGEMIESFPIPNNREDFIEFYSFISAEVLNGDGIALFCGTYNKHKAKLASMRKKAPLLFPYDTALVDNLLQDEKKIKDRTRKALILYIGGIIGFFVFTGVISLLGKLI